MGLCPAGVWCGMEDAGNYWLFMSNYNAQIATKSIHFSYNRLLIQKQWHANAQNPEWRSRCDGSAHRLPLFRACTAVSTEDSSRSSSEPGTEGRSGVASPFTHGAGTEQWRKGATDTPFRLRGFEFWFHTTESFREISAQCVLELFGCQRPR